MMQTSTETDQVPAATPETQAPPPRQGRRLRYPAAVVIALAAAALILAACGGAGDSNGRPPSNASPASTPTGGGLDEEGDEMPSVASGSESEAMAEDLAPNFTFTLFQGEDELGGEELDLDRLRGKPVVLNFWAGLCPPCRAEMPDLQEFYEVFGDRVILLGIDLGQFTGLGNRQDAQKLLNDLEVTYPAGYTTDAGIVRAYSVLGMPTTVFIDADGEVFKSWTGALNREVLEEQTNSLLGQ